MIGEGEDTLAGGPGNDTYIADGFFGQIREYGDEGIDLVQTDLSEFVLADYVEDLMVIASGGNFFGHFTGNALRNKMTGSTGRYTLEGLAGDDVLDGAAEADSLVGGWGNDTYVVDHAGDVVVENAGQGRDTVVSSVDFSLFGIVVEAVVLTGAADIDATGNSLSNILTGNSGNNRLSGGLGDDTYYVQNAGDQVIEKAGEGKDTVVASLTWSLSGALVENLTLTGSGALNGTGNGLGSTLVGNSGNNILNGMAAKDVLTGGLGAHVFLFTANTGADRITDFHLAQGDSVNVSAYTAGLASAGLVSQSGLDVVIDLGGGNTVSVLNAVRGEVLQQIIW